MALAGRRGGLVSASTKSTPTDMVTEFDRASEAMITEALRAARPGDAIIAEEGTSVDGTGSITWHIDPIDGTTNFFFGLPTWAVSVGAVDEHGPVAGAVYCPPLGEMFSAARGRGARLNGEPIGVRDNSDLADALLATGFSYDAADRVRQSRLIPTMIDRVRDIRRFGAAALDICFVACGRLDGYFEENLHSWDVVAAHVVALEAGALVTDFAGGPVHPSNVLAASPGVHRAVVDLLAAREPAGPVQ
jgi:myo-inositol-1(or 4)-monophosphatase